MYVDQQYDRLFLKVRNPGLVLQHLPDVTEEIKWRGHNLVVPHTIESTRLLRNIGINAPSPIRHQYNWPRPSHIKQPFAHQIDTSEFLTLNRRCFVLSEMGTSKTASALWAADYLMNTGRVKKAIIVAPLSTLTRVWRDEIFNFIMHRTGVVLYGDRERRRDLLNSGADFYIINYEGLEIILPELQARKDINLMIVDEVAAYRNSENDRYDILCDAIQPKQRLWLMSGTPCPNAPTDAWALARLIDSRRVPQHFSTWERKTMVRFSTYKWFPRVGSNEMVYDVLQPAIRFRKKDCLDLPPVTYESRECRITKEQMEAFRRMKQFMVANADGHEIDAVNAADKIGKMRQILCGAVKDPETGEYLVLPHKPRLRVLLEGIEGAGAKVIVVVPFKGIVQTLHKEVSEYYDCEVVNGDVTPKRRDEIWRRFKHEKTPEVVLCHPQVMAHGLTLTEADRLIFYAPIYSNEQSQQVMERINRPGQLLPMTILRIGGNALEWEIYERVEGRRVSQESILDMYQNIVMGKYDIIGHPGTPVAIRK